MNDNILSDNHQVVNDATALYRQKEYVRAYEKVRPLMVKGEVPPTSTFSCAWIICRYIKQMCDNLSLDNLNVCVGFFLSNIVSEPSLVRSVFLSQMIDISKKCKEFDFLSFCCKFDILNLRQEDYIGNKAVLSERVVRYESLAEKLATRIYNVMKSSKTRQCASLLMPFLMKVKEKCPENKFIDMYIGLMNYWMGNRELAYKLFVEILLTNPQWYIWKNMSYVTDDHDKKVAFLCKAITMIDDERYKGNLHLQLAEMLSDSDPSHAAMEIARFFETYSKNNWRICGDAYILQNKLKGISAATDSYSFYMQNAKNAENVVYKDVDAIEMSFVREVMVHGKRKAKFQALNSKTSINVSLSMLGRKVNVGDVFSVRYKMHDHSLVVLTLNFLRACPNGSNIHMEKLLEVSGNVSLPRSGGFAFIDKKYYVSNKLRSKCQLTEGQNVKAVVCQAEDGRWRVVKILKY